MTVQDIITLVGIVFASNGLWQYLSFKAQQKEKRKEQENSSKSGADKLLLGIAFKIIVESCQHYIEVGHISPDEYKELNHYLFEPYKEMGGDGTAERLICEVAKLPIE